MKPGIMVAFLTSSALSVEGQVLRLLLLDEGERLVLVIATIEFLDVAARLRVVVPEVPG